MEMSSAIATAHSNQSEMDTGGSPQVVYNLEAEFDSMNIPKFVALSSVLFVGESVLYHPLDVIRTRLQVTTAGQQGWRGLQTLIGRLGVRGLYTGFMPSAIGHLPGNAVYLLSYSYLKDRLQRIDDNMRRSYGLAPTHGHQAFWVSLTAAAVADGIACAFYCPIEIIVQRLVIQDKLIYNNGIHAAKQMWKNEGFKGFYRGFGAYTLNYIPATALWWVSYEQFKHVFSKMVHQRAHSDNRSSTLVVEQHWGAQFAAGAVAGAITTTVTNPLDVIRTRLQTQHHMHASNAPMPSSSTSTPASTTSSPSTASAPTTSKPKIYNAWDTIKVIWRTEGTKGFAKGYSPRLLSSVVLSSLHAFLYEYIVSASQRQPKGLN